jgi:hypothetical protein
MASTKSTVVAGTGAAVTDTGQAADVERPDPRSRAEIASSLHARELAWLDDIRRGYSIKEIARREGLGCRRIQHGVARARERGNVSRIRYSRSSNQVHERNQNSIAGAGRAAGDDPNRPPRLFPLFPIGPFTPRSACPHHGPIRAGSVFCCMVCSRSGIDDHPALKRDPRTDPRPESKAAAPARVASVHETRRQRRQRLHAARQARLGTVASLAKDAPGPTSQSSIPSP